MSSHNVTQASDIGVSLRLEGWKVAIATGTAVVLAPVMGFVLLVLLATMLPLLPLVPILFVGFWWRRPDVYKRQFYRSSYLIFLIKVGDQENVD